MPGGWPRSIEGSTRGIRSVAAARALRPRRAAGRPPWPAPRASPVAQRSRSRRLRVSRFGRRPRAETPRRWSCPGSLRTGRW